MARPEMGQFIESDWKLDRDMAVAAFALYCICHRASYNTCGNSDDAYFFFSNLWAAEISSIENKGVTEVNEMLKGMPATFRAMMSMARGGESDGTND